MRPSECEAWKQIEGWLSEAEADSLYEAASGVPAGGCIVEIGSFKGRSTYALALGSGRGVTVYAVDPFTGSPTENASFPSGFKVDFDHNLMEFVRRSVVHPLVMSSAGASMRGINPDLVFVDGSHVYEDALFDMVTWWEKLKSGGRMAIHDTQGTHSSVRHALEDFLTRYALRAQFVTWSIAWVRKGEAE